MPPQHTVVIFGARPTAATAATNLREGGFDGRIVLVGSEPHLPYERPPLSKGYLMGTAERDSVFVHPAEWYTEHDVELRLGTPVAAIDRAAHKVVLDDGERLAWTPLVLATGSSPRRLDVPGTDLPGVHYLRSLDDAEALAAGFANASKVVVVGGGWIGLETAAAARAAGLDVVVLEQAALPLNRVLGSRVAQIFADLHREHGGALRTWVTVTEVLGSSPGGGAHDGTTGSRVAGVRLSDGTEIAADLVVVGVGIVPNVQLATDAGLTMDNGIVVDEHLRTSAPDIWAAGDVANAPNRAAGKQLRVEHWANAVRHGEVVAHSLLGTNQIDERPPYFFTDQYDLGCEYVGYADENDEVVVRGDVASRELIAFWLREGQVVAGMNINVWDVTEQIEALITSGRVVDPVRLADTGIALTEL